MRTHRIAIVLLLRELEEYMDAFRTHGELLLRATLAARAAVDGTIAPEGRAPGVQRRQQHGRAGIGGGGEEPRARGGDTGGDGVDHRGIPDSLSRELLQEVKFTTSGKLGISDQLRDFISFAKGTGRKMELIVPEGTEIVGELKDAWLRGDLDIKFFLP